MVEIYATLIRLGRKSIDDVPKQLRDEVQAKLDNDKDAQD